MRYFFCLLAASLLAITPAAHADSFQLSINSSFVSLFDSPNDNYWGEYSTARPDLVDPPSIRSFAATTFSSISVTIPKGNRITWAWIEVFGHSAAGTGQTFAGPSFAPPHDGPSIAPTFGNSGSSEVSADFDDYASGSLIPLIEGNRVSTGDLNLMFDLYGRIWGDLTNPGDNWSGYITGNGKATIPYTVELNVEYSPVPEPSTIALLGTGLVGLAGVARRKFAA